MTFLPAQSLVFNSGFFLQYFVHIFQKKSSQHHNKLFAPPAINIYFRKEYDKESFSQFWLFWVYFEFIIQIQSYRQISYKHAENIQQRNKIIKLSQILGVIGIFQMSFVHIFLKMSSCGCKYFWMHPTIFTPLQKDCYNFYIVIQKNVSQILRHIIRLFNNKIGFCSKSSWVQKYISRMQKFIVSMR